MFIDSDAHVLVCSGVDTKAKIVVTERALFQRINRKLKEEGEQLRTARTPAVEASVERYYILDVNRNFIAHEHVEMEALGRELGVLQPWEKVGSESQQNGYSK
jgi:hypothetical protein